MDGNTANHHLEPDDADLRAQQLLMLRFENENRICPIAALKASQRAVAAPKEVAHEGGMLLDDMERPIVDPIAERDYAAIQMPFFLEAAILSRMRRR
jgi:hypothetical protein